MLPPLGQLSLGPAPMPAPTGEFYELSEPEADALNANNGREPLTFDDYVPHRARGQEGATFRLYWDQKRVLKNPPGHRTAEELEAHGKSLYAVYDAKALWEWVKTHEKDPTGSFKISYEDWMELYAEYGNFGDIPEFVSKLPSLEWPDFGPDTVWDWKETGVHEWSNTIWTGGSWSATVDGAKRFDTFTDFTKLSQEANFLPTDGIYYSGPPGAERITKVRHGRWTDFLRGGKGHEQLYKQYTPNGVTKFFATDEEPRASRNRVRPEFRSEHIRGRLIRAISADGLRTLHYKGPKNFERLDYVDGEPPDADGVPGRFDRVHYTGRKRLERVYKVERFSRLGNGRLYDTHHLRGPKGYEYPYKRVAGDGKWVAYYETGQEHRMALRRVQTKLSVSGDAQVARDAGDPYPHTSNIYYEGPRGGETFVRAEVLANDGVVIESLAELPLDDPEDRARQMRVYNWWRQKHSAWAPVRFLDEQQD